MTSEEGDSHDLIPDLTISTYLEQYHSLDSNTRYRDHIILK